jgi:hypothetical protein
VEEGDRAVGLPPISHQNPVVDKVDFLNDIKGGTKAEHVHQGLETTRYFVAFQADDEGSIPFTRSNDFNGLTHATLAVPTSRLLISCSGKCPRRTGRWRPSSVNSSAWQLSKAATSASTPCDGSARAPLRRTSVSGSANVAGWESCKTVVSATAYHSFGAEMGGFEHPHDTRP